MKLLKYIEDKQYKEDKNIWKRFASRAIAFDETGKIPLEYVSKFDFYKLPGGGIEKGEDEITACKREMKEETGCDIEIVKEIGKVEEYRSKFHLYQTSYCYLGKITSKGTPHWEPGEIEDGHQLVWMTLSQAIETIRGGKTSDYEGKFIQTRDLVLLKEAERIIS